MYKYKYVEVELNGLFQTANHHEVIDQHAKEGWRFVQLLPIRYNGHGKPTEYEIIFEQNIED